MFLMNQKMLSAGLALALFLGVSTVCRAQEEQAPEPAFSNYTIGVNDILEISVLEPDTMNRVVNVAPDGTIMFPFIGQVNVLGRTVPEVQQEIRDRLNDGYLKYPVVLVALQESRSRQYLVYGEVIRPGSYPITDNTTVLRAISVAGGFSKFGSSSRVKVLRSREDQPGYETIRVDIKAVMDGDSGADLLLKPGDMVVVSEGVF